MRSDKGVTGLGLAKSVFLILGHGSLFPRGIELLKAALGQFFYPQFQTKLMPGIRPVAVLHHPYDSLLPFVPKLARCYLGYMTVWLKTIQYLYSAFGEEAIADIEQTFQDICLLYYTAGKVYRKCQSTTTTRRTDLFNPHFLLIYLFDPHLHCVPSLHVMTVCYNYLKARQIIDKHSPDKKKHALALRQTYRLALHITETILLVKQHSVMDIGPSLFLLSSLFPEYDQAEVKRFTEDLFHGTPFSDLEAANKIRGQIYNSYRSLVRLRAKDGHQKSAEIILGFLTSFSRDTRLSRVS